MKYLVILSAMICLAGCDESNPKPITKEIEKTRAHVFSIERDLTNNNGPHSLYRIENDEVICYETGGEAMSCKWKVTPQ